MRKEQGIKMQPSAAKDHEVNGVIESANAALGIFFNRIRSFKTVARVNDILSEAT